MNRDLAWIFSESVGSFCFETLLFLWKREAAYIPTYIFYRWHWSTLVRWNLWIIECYRKPNIKTIVPSVWVFNKEKCQLLSDQLSVTLKISHVYFFNFVVHIYLTLNSVSKRFRKAANLADFPLRTTSRHQSDENRLCSLAMQICFYLRKLHFS